MVVENVLSSLQSNVSESGLFKFIMETINGSCYECLKNESNWMNYSARFMSDSNYKNYRIFAYLSIFLLVVLVVASLICVLLYITNRMYRTVYKDTNLFYLFIFILIICMFSIHLFTIIPLLSDSHNTSTTQKQSLPNIINQISNSTSEFIDSSFVQSQTHISIPQLLNDIIAILTKMVESIFSNIMKRLESDEMLRKGPILIADIIQLNQSFIHLSQFYVEIQPIVNKFIYDVRSFENILKIYSANECNSTNFDEPIDKSICQHIKVYLDNSSTNDTIRKVHLKLDVTILLKRSIEIAKSVLKRGISTKFLEDEMNKVTRDVNKVIPDAVRDLKKEIPIKLILNKSELYFEMLTNSSNGIVENIRNVSKNEKVKMVTNTCTNIELFGILFLTFIHFFNIFTLFSILEKNCQIIQSILILLLFTITLLFILIFILSSFIQNDVIKYFKQNNQTRQFDILISHQINYEYQKQLNIIKQKYDFIFLLLNIPMEFPNTILNSIKNHCTNENETLLSILNFKSLFRLENVKNLRLFKSRIGKIESDAYIKMIEAFKKIKIPEVPADQKDIIIDLLNKLLNPADINHNLKIINDYIDYINEFNGFNKKLQRLLYKQKRNGFSSDILKKFLIKIETDYRIVKKQSVAIRKSLKFVNYSTNLPHRISNMLDKSGRTLKIMRNATKMKHMLHVVIETEIDKVLVVLNDKFNGFFDGSIGKYVSNCTKFQNIMTNLSELSNYSTSFLHILFGDILIGFHYFVFLIFIYLWYFKFQLL